MHDYGVLQSISPGVVDTEMIPPGFLESSNWSALQPADISEAVLFVRLLFMIYNYLLINNWNLFAGIRNATACSNS